MKKLLCAALLFCLSVSFAGCSGPALWSSDQWDRVKESGVLRFGTEGTYRPMTYHDEVSGELTGFEVEVAQAVAERMGLKAEFVETSWDAMAGALQEGKVDVLINEINPTQKRSEAYDFSIPYCYAQAAVVVRADTRNIRCLEDLNGRKAAEFPSTSYSDFAAESGAWVIDAESFADSMNKVSSGAADLCLNSELPVDAYLTEYPDCGLRIAFYLGMVNPSVILIAKGEDRLAEKIDEAIRSLQEDGTLKGISEKYFGKDVTENPDESK